jgi:hypothetical protein
LDKFPVLRLLLGGQEYGSFHGCGSDMALVVCGSEKASPPFALETVRNARLSYIGMRHLESVSLNSRSSDLWIKGDE